MRRDPPPPRDKTYRLDWAYRGRPLKVARQKGSPWTDTGPPRARHCYLIVPAIYRAQATAILAGIFPGNSFGRALNTAGDASPATDYAVDVTLSQARWERWVAAAEDAYIPWRAYDRGVRSEAQILATEALKVKP